MLLWKTRCFIQTFSKSERFQNWKPKTNHRIDRFLEGKDYVQRETRWNVTRTKVDKLLGHNRCFYTFKKSELFKNSKAKNKRYKKVGKITWICKLHEGTYYPDTPKPALYYNSDPMSLSGNLSFCSSQLLFCSNLPSSYYERSHVTLKREKMWFEFANQQEICF